MRLAGKSLFDFTRLVRSALLMDLYGTSFPVVTQEGFRFYRTDLDEWFEYRPTWGGWLGTTRQYLTSFSTASLAAANYAPGFSATLGLVAPHRMKVMRVSITTPGVSGCRWEIRGDGTILTGAVYDMGEDSTITFAADLNNDSPASAAQILAPYLNLGTATNGYSFEAELRRLALSNE